ncbi:MAG: hypothetical protein LC730_06900, partial [Acidobacteria bacterium]|nr:hypothetical protein [Acidobacteriota bacterium]
VSEWMGGNGVDEGFLPAVLVARDRWLTPHGKMLPEKVSAWIAPVFDSEVENDLNYWRDRPYEFDFSLVTEAIIGEVRYCQHHVTESTLVARPQRMWTTDVYTCPVDEARSPYAATLSFSATRKCSINAMASWFHADFGQNIVLTNAPGAPETHWGRFVFPLKRTVKVELETKISVEFVCEPTIDSHCKCKWSVKIGDREWEHHQSVS